MSEKRKPDIKLTIEVRGARLKVELFPAHLWEYNLEHNYGPCRMFEKRFDARHAYTHYRVRLNGRWWQGNSLFTISSAMNLVRRSLVKKLKSKKINDR